MLIFFKTLKSKFDLMQEILELEDKIYIRDLALKSLAEEIQTLKKHKCKCQQNPNIRKFEMKGINKCIHEI